MDRQCWKVGERWRLVVEETPSGWRLREASDADEGGAVPMRWIDSTRAFGEASEEVLLKGRERSWGLRLYPGRRVLAAGPLDGAVLELPPQWWVEVDVAASPFPTGIGSPGSTLADLVSSESRGWEGRLDPSGESGRATRAEFRMVTAWSRIDAEFGDTEVLHRLAPQTSSRALRERFQGQDRVVLDCRSLFLDTDGERDLADALLFVHQEYGAPWVALDAPPSAILERAVERAHMDSQGDLFAAWIPGDRVPPGRPSWRRLGPILGRSSRDADCYVWER